MSKIFGIGLSKTATTSLNDALIQLGHDSVHFPFMSYTSGGLVLSPDCVQRHDAFTDTPVANCFKYLDNQYPHSKFIYTVRDIDGWLDSCETHFKRYDFNLSKVVNHFKWAHLQYSLYGGLSFDRGRYRSAYLQHDRSVKNHFEGREDDLLVLNICGGEGWGKLCSFLGEPVPSRSFPQSNITDISSE